MTSDPAEVRPLLASVAVSPRSDANKEAGVSTKKWWALAAGRCQIVAGPVGPRGYCIVWAARNPKNGC